MSSNSIIFQFHPKKITFKTQTTESNPLHFKLLYNNKKISGTEILQIPQGNRQFDTCHLSCLLFDTKDETIKYPIIIYVLYGQKNPAKKIILKRSEMLKKYETEKKDHFNFQEDFGVFSIFYEVQLKNVVFESVEFIKQNELLESKDSNQTNKTEESPNRTFKRPSMLQIGAKAERIRKSSYQNKQENSQKNNSKPNEPIIKSHQKNPQTLTKLVSNLTLSKEQEESENLVKKDVKVNLFEAFNSKSKEQKPNNEIIKNQSEKQKDPQSQSHHSHRNHESTQFSHHQLQTPHEHPSDDHHSSHDSHENHEHEHEESHPLSLKLKTVILMLIVGFLFLMYDALDDRFSRKITKKESVVHTDAHGDLHQGQGKKKKTDGKKRKKIVTH